MNLIWNFSHWFAGSGTQRWILNGKTCPCGNCWNYQIFHERWTSERQSGQKSKCQSEKGPSYGDHISRLIFLHLKHDYVDDCLYCETLSHFFSEGWEQITNAIFDEFFSRIGLIMFPILIKVFRLNQVTNAFWRKVMVIFFIFKGTFSPKTNYYMGLQ